jgi:hypothetical protein
MTRILNDTILIQDFDVGASSLISLLVIRRHIPVERTYFSGGVIAFVNERFGDVCAYASRVKRIRYQMYCKVQEAGVRRNGFQALQYSHRREY